MSHLKALKLTSAAPAHASNDPVLRARDKMIMALVEQKQMADAKIAGQLFAPTHAVWRKNEAGQKIQIQAPKRVRQSWFVDASGKLFLGLRYAGKIIEFAKDKNAIEVGELTALPVVIEALVEAIRAGELDGQLTTAAAERGKLLRKSS